MASTLVVVPCGASKVWARNPNAGAVAACDAYTGPPFRLNRQYADRFGDAWVILSAKYGFLAPDVRQEGPYGVTFKRVATGPISVEALRVQVVRDGLDRYDRVIGLGGLDYRQAIEAAFAGTAVRLDFPFAGLALGYTMQAVRRALDAQP